MAFLWVPPNTQNSNLALDIVTVNFPLDECKHEHCPATDWCPVQGVFPPHTQCSWNNESTDLDRNGFSKHCAAVQEFRAKWQSAKTSQVIFNLL